MKAMDISMEEDDCAVEVIKPAKKKKLKQAQLPFQTLSSPKSSLNSANVVSNKKKRKIVSPLVEFKSSKISKGSKKDRFDENIAEDTREQECIAMTDDEKEDAEQSNWQNDENRKGDVMPKRSSLGKKDRDRVQQKSGALTKFLKRTNENKDTDDGDTRRPKAEEDLTSVQEERNEVYSDGNLDKLQVPRAKETLESTDNARDKDTKQSSIEQSDLNVITLSSDNETPTKLDESTTSANDENGKSTDCVTPETNKDAGKKLKNLTPKQLEKRREIARKKEEKLKQKMEKEKKREEEKASRRKEREEKQKEKEEKEKMEKEQKKKEKELKELKKQLEIEQKQKDKEAKEEERKKREEAKEEERRKREEAKEERKRKEEEKLEAERRKQKAASNFASFFVSKKHEVKKEDESAAETRNFMPFEIKADMKIAPVCRRVLKDREKLSLDEKCNVDSAQSCELYLEEVRTSKVIPRTSSRTWPIETKDDVIPLDDDNGSDIVRQTHDLEKRRPKLLQFKENRRPPYWGTWRKRSEIVNSRRPFAKDEKWFDYDIDSDDEWEEEEPGESLKGSDDEDEENPEENEYDVDNEFMVPHGYLSDEEVRADEEEEEDTSPHTQKLKLKILKEQFEAERNAKTQKLKPKIIGCVWEGAGNTFSKFVSEEVRETLSARRAWIRSIPIMLPSATTTEAESTAAMETSTRGPKKTKFPNEALADLIRLLHGNTHGRRFLMREFMTFWHRKTDGQLSKTSVLQKINGIANRMACPDEGPMHLKSCWYVSDDIRKQYLPDEELPLPNRWSYILTPTAKSRDPQNVADKSDKEECEREKVKKHVPLITQFAKKITHEEMKKQLMKSKGRETDEQSAPRIVEQIKPKPSPQQRLPKRATLISVGRGEQFPVKCHTLARYVSIGKKREEASTSNEKMIIDDDNDDDIVFMESINVNEAENAKLETCEQKIAVNPNDDNKPSKGGSAGGNVVIIDDYVKSGGFGK